MTIGEKIKYRRRIAGLTLTGAAERLEKSKQQWEQWESGVRIPNYTSLEQIASVLEINVDELVSEPNPTEPAEVLL